jgi:hypothetical protein
LVAEIDATSIVLPYDHIKLIMGFVRGAYDHAIKEHLEDTEFITKLDDALAYSFNNRLDRMRNSATNDVLQIEQIHLSRLRQLNALYKVKITNKGNVPLNGVFLRFPDTSLISEQIGHAKREGGGEIAIGILKQRAEVSFFIWGDAIYSVTTTPVQEVVVGHNDGIGKVIITRRY